MPHRRSALVVVPVAVAALVIAVALEPGLGRRPVGLADYLGWRDAQTPELAAREARAVQHRIAACMGGARAWPIANSSSRRPTIPTPSSVRATGRRSGASACRPRSGSSTRRRRPRDPNLAYIEALAANDQARVPRRPLRFERPAGLQRPGERGGLRPPRPAARRARSRTLPGSRTRIAARPPHRRCRRPVDGLHVERRRSDRRAAGGSGRRRSTSLTRRLEAVMGPPPGDPASTGRRSRPAGLRDRAAPSVGSTATRRFGRSAKRSVSSTRRGSSTTTGPRSTTSRRRRSGSMPSSDSHPAQSPDPVSFEP